MSASLPHLWVAIGSSSCAPAATAFLYCGFDFFNDKIEMDVASNAARSFCAARLNVRRACESLGQQIDWSGATKHFDPGGTKATTDLQTKDGTVKSNGLIEIVDI
jgi:hypothetical protein